MSPKKYIRLWVKLNVNRASKGNLGSVRCGRLIRDVEDKWIYSFACNLGICSSMMATFWGAKHGQQLAWSFSFKKIILESNSKNLTTALIQNKPTCQTSKALFLQCRNLLCQRWEGRIKHQHRTDVQIS